MLDTIRVLDLADERGMVCGFMLAELGADVIAVEPKAGARARLRGPFAGETRDKEQSLPWWAWARSKRSVALDLADDQADLLRLIDSADVLIESEAPGEMARRGLGYDALRERNPGLVYVSITPFGQTGPKANWAASDLTVLAAGGPLWLCGDDDRAPVRVTVPQAFPHAAAEAAAATLVALRERRRSGLGQHVDVSAQQAVTLATQSDVVAVGIGEAPGSRYAGGAKLGPFVLRLVYPARDGHVSITHVFGSAIGPVTARMMEAVHADGFCDEAMCRKDWVGLAENIAMGREPAETFERAKQAIAAWTGSKTKAELLQLALDRDLLIAPVATPRDVLESSQLAARSYFQPLERPDGRGTTRQLGRFARFGDIRPTPPRPAPRIGQHTREVLAELASRDRATVRPPQPADAGGELPLAGVKILDFMWAIAGPMSTRMLADYGATVVRVESTIRLDVCRTMRPYVDGVTDTENAALFHSCNANKRGITLDLAHPDAREVVLDLARWADVVCEAFTPGAMAKLGFDHASLGEVNPDLIMLSTCLMGQSGPLATYAGYGNLAAAFAGFFEMAGWADRDPAGPFGAYTDYIAPRFNATAILAALDHRDRTGEGLHIDLSQAEAALHFLAPALLDEELHQHGRTRDGNRDDRYAPHGCYPVVGEDAWIAITVEDDAQWQALCELMGSPELARDSRFASERARVAEAEALDALLGDYTRRQTGEALEEALQARGIAAHRVLDSAGLWADPQLRARGHFVEIEDAGIRSVVEATRSRLSRTPARPPETLPTLGRDNFEVLGGVLGYDDEKIVQLLASGALD